MIFHYLRSSNFDLSWADLEITLCADKSALRVILMVNFLEFLKTKKKIQNLRHFKHEPRDPRIYPRIYSFDHTLSALRVILLVGDQVSS